MSLFWSEVHLDQLIKNYFTYFTLPIAIGRYRFYVESIIFLSNPSISLLPPLWFWCCSDPQQIGNHEDSHFFMYDSDQMETLEDKLAKLNQAWLDMDFLSILKWTNEHEHLFRLVHGKDYKESRTQFREICLVMPEGILISICDSQNVDWIFGSCFRPFPLRKASSLEFPDMITRRGWLIDWEKMKCEKGRNKPRLLIPWGIRRRKELWKVSHSQNELNKEGTRKYMVIQTFPSSITQSTDLWLYDQASHSYLRQTRAHERNGSIGMSPNRSD